MSLRWYVPPRPQYNLARQLWPGITVPEPPSLFVPQTPTEVLLLHCPDSLTNLWNLIQPPAFTTKRWELPVNSEELYLVSNKDKYTTPVWIAFDPERGRNKCPSDFTDQTNVAASEVLSAMIQFPKWCWWWVENASAPFLGGCRFTYEGEEYVPLIDRCQGELSLYYTWPEDDTDGWAIPSVRLLY